MSQKKHTAVWVSELVADLRPDDVSEAEFGRSLGLDLAELATDDAALPIDDIASLFERAADATGDTLLGFHRGTFRDTRHIGLIAYVGLAAPNVADYIANLSRYRRVFSEALELDASSIRKDGRVRWALGLSPEAQGRQFVEFGAAGMIGEFRRITGVRLHPEELMFEHGREDGIEEMTRYFGCPIKFGAGQNLMRFSRETLDLPLLTSDEYLLKVLQTCCERTLEDLPSVEGSITARTEGVISEILASGGIAQADVAARLGMSSRTFARRLSQEDTSFSRILREYRHRLALDLLKDTDLQLQQIAYLLGFDDASSFTAAFRTWTGSSPRSYRDTHIR